jgi:hypothetical protein
MAFKYDTSAISTDGRLVIDMSNEIALLQPSEAPFVALTKRLTKEQATNPEFKWLERELEARWDAVNNSSNIAADGTEIVVDHGSYFRAGMLVKNPRTGEVVLVSSISTNTLTVVRAFGETSAAIMNDNDPLLILGNVNEEGATAPGDAGGSPSAVSNYTQIFRTPFSVTNTANASKVYGSNKLLLQEQKDKGVLHRIDMERSFLFGEFKEDTTGTNVKRATRGLLGFLDQNTTDASGALTETEFNTWLRDVFKYGSSKKMLLASPLVVSVIDSWGVGKLQLVPEAQATYGLHVNRYICSHGELLIVKEPLFEGTIYGGYAAAIDLGNIKYRYMQGRDTSLKTNIQANDADGRRDEYLTEAGLEVRLPKTHGLLTGVTGAS